MREGLMKRKLNMTRIRRGQFLYHVLCCLNFRDPFGHAVGFLVVSTASICIQVCKIQWGQIFLWSCCEMGKSTLLSHLHLWMHLPFSPQGAQFSLHCLRDRISAGSFWVRLMLAGGVALGRRLLSYGYPTSVCL